MTKKNCTHRLSTKQPKMDIKNQIIHEYLNAEIQSNFNFLYYSFTKPETRKHKDHHLYQY
jgi:hypothetical protein